MQELISPPNRVQPHVKRGEGVKTQPDFNQHQAGLLLGGKDQRAFNIGLHLNTEPAVQHREYA